MGRCDHCGAAIRGESAFTCNYCERSHCAEHRLPERHDCVNIDLATGPGMRIRQQIGVSGAEADGNGAGAAIDDEGLPERGAGSTCERCGDPAPHGLEYCNDCRAEIIDEQDGRGRANDKPDKTPCEECGRPCPSDQEYCSPCQKDIRDRKRRPATTEEIRQHWRENEITEGPPDLTLGQRIRAALPRVKRLLFYAIVAAVLGYVVLERQGVITELVADARGVVGIAALLG